MTLEPTEPPSVLTWHSEPEQAQRVTWLLTIKGPKGTVTCPGIIWVTARRDYIEDCYWSMVNALEGVYHCCYTDRCLWVR